MKKLVSLISAWVAGAMAFAQVPAEDYQWKNIPIGAGGYITGIVYSPVVNGLTYCFTDMGGAYRWDDVTKTWTSISDNEGLSGNVEGLAADPKDGNIVYMASGGSIARSTDRGNTWTKYSLPVFMDGNADVRGEGKRLVIHPTKTNILFYGSRDKGLWQSTTSGQNWFRVASFPATGDTLLGGVKTILAGIHCVEFDRKNPNILYAAAGTLDNSKTFFTSTNGGASWRTIPGPLHASTAPFVVHHMEWASNGKLWVTFGTDYAPYPQYNLAARQNRTYKDQGSVWTYTISTGTWTNVTPFPKPDPRNYLVNGLFGGLSVDAQNPNHVIVSTVLQSLPDIIVGTTNGGVNWSVVAKPSVNWDKNPVNCTSYDRAGKMQNLSNTSTIVGEYSTHWMEAIAINPFNGNKAFYATGGSIFSSDNILEDTIQNILWTERWKGIEQAATLEVTPSTNGPFFSLVGDLGGFRHESLDEPLVSYYGFFTNPHSNNTTSLDFAGMNSNRVVRVALDQMGYSEDNGMTWNPTPANPPGFYGTVAISALGNHIVYVPSPASTAKGCYFSDDKGASWTAIPGLTNANTSIVSDRVNDNWFYALFNNEVYVSVDGGHTFAKKTSSTNFKVTGTLRAVFGQEGEFWAEDIQFARPGTGGTIFLTPKGLTNFTYANGQLGYRATSTAIWQWGYNQTNSGPAGMGSIGFGKAAPGQNYPTIYALGYMYTSTVNLATNSYVRGNAPWGIFRSTDKGATWTQINNGKGFVNSQYVGGDENVYGRVYLGTNGRGLFYGEPTNGFVDDCGVAVGGTAKNDPCSEIQEGVYQISPVNNLSYCLVNGATSLIQSTCDSTGATESQRWKLNGNATGYYTLQNESNSGYLTIASTASGARLLTSTSNALSQFRLEYAGFIGVNVPTYRIVPASALGQSVGNKTSKGINFFVQGRYASDNQRFVFQYLASNSSARTSNVLLGDESSEAA
ncbi:MAG: RICIN domain-containing protein, partial [Cytophagales bacterium]|nr:RICIN domain-containing protein [Cytophagales bacterium]